MQTILPDVSQVTINHLLAVATHGMNPNVSMSYFDIDIGAHCMQLITITWA